MSSYGLFEADAAIQSEPERQQRTAAVKLQSAIDEVRKQYGTHLAAATGVDDFDDRWNFARHDIRHTINAFIPPVAGVMKRVRNAMKADFKARAGLPQDQGTSRVASIPEIDASKLRTGDFMKGAPFATYKDFKDCLASNSSKDDPHAYCGYIKHQTEDKKTSSAQRRELEASFRRELSRRDLQAAFAELGKLERWGGQDGDEPELHTQETFEDHQDENLVPEGDFSGYLEDVSQGAPAKVAPNFGQSGDSGSDRHGYRQGGVVDHYKNWLAQNGYDHDSIAMHDYMQEHPPGDRGSTELFNFHDDHQYGPYRAGAKTGDEISDQAEKLRENAGKDTDEKRKEMTSYRHYADIPGGAPAPLTPDNAGGGSYPHTNVGPEIALPGGNVIPGIQNPTQGLKTGASMALDLYTDWATSNGLRCASLNTLAAYAQTGIDNSDYHAIEASIRQAEIPPQFQSDDDDDEDDQARAEEAEDEERDIQEGEDSDDEEDDDDDSDDEDDDEDSDDEEDDEDEGDDEGDEDEGGDDDDEDDGPPWITGSHELVQARRDMQWAIQADRRRFAAFPPQDDDQQGGDQGPPDQGPPQDAGPPPGQDPGQQGPPQPPEAPQAAPGGGAPMENQPAEDALLDTASQAVMQMIDRETQEYQSIIDPLTQALQAIEMAQQVEQAEHPLDVTPPQGSVDVTPSAALGGAQDLQQQQHAASMRQLQAACDREGLAYPAELCAHLGRVQEARNRSQKRVRRGSREHYAAVVPHLSRIARVYGMPRNAVKMVLTAMGRRHYQQVADAIASLPPQHRTGIAASLGDMFGADNPRFVHDRFYAAAGVDPRYARRRQAAEGDVPWGPLEGPIKHPFHDEPEMRRHLPDEGWDWDKLHDIERSNPSSKYGPELGPYHPGNDMSDLFADEPGSLERYDDISRGFAQGEAQRTSRRNPGSRLGFNRPRLAGPYGDPRLIEKYHDFVDANHGGEHSMDAAEDFIHHHLDGRNWEAQGLREYVNEGLGDPGNYGQSQSDLARQYGNDPESVRIDPSSGRFEGRRRQAASWALTPTLDTFQFPQAKAPVANDNIAVDNLPGTTPTGNPSAKATPVKPVKPLTQASLNAEAKSVMEQWKNYSQQRAQQGLVTDPEPAFEGFSQAVGPKVSPKALDMVKQKVVAPKQPKVSSFFNRRVPGWTWDDHLNGYITSARRPFECSCGEHVPTPSYGTCRCGKIWNTYAIGTQDHLANNSADMFIAREIPVRDGVIMANQAMANGQSAFRTAASQADWDQWNEHARTHTPQLHDDRSIFHDREDDRFSRPSSYVQAAAEESEGQEWIEDEDRGKVDVGHAPAPRKQGGIGPDDHTVTYKDGERCCSACGALLWDPNVHHCPAKQASRYQYAADATDTPGPGVAVPGMNLEVGAGGAPLNTPPGPVATPGQTVPSPSGGTYGLNPATPGSKSGSRYFESDWAVYGADATNTPGPGMGAVLDDPATPPGPGFTQQSPTGGTIGLQPTSPAQADRVGSRMFEADWTVYDDDVPQGGPGRPPVTDVKKPPSDWAKRDGKGNWVGPAVPRTSPKD